MQEVEFKFALAVRAEYDRVRAALGEPRKSAVQVNHYFTGDRGGVLGRGEALLRLRVTPSKAVLTFKDGLRKQGALYRCREIEDEVSPGERDGLLEGRLHPLELDREASRVAAGALGPGRLRVAGASETERTEFAFRDGETLLLDRTRFPGGLEDYEIELETADPAGAEAALHALFGRLGIEARPQPRTKFARFLDALSRRTGGA
ncbi:MAG: CYTH domain-containing protein [Planctomycetes bacterium]|jgi:uncharacterized protein YjbK|nr:CYTH domain-containing protein [Planctomycetota bacterium]